MYFPTKIKNLLSPGDFIYLMDGSEKKVEKVCNLGFYAGGLFYLYSDHRFLYFLTLPGLNHFLLNNP